MAINTTILCNLILIIPYNAVDIRSSQVQHNETRPCDNINRSKPHPSLIIQNICRLGNDEALERAFKSWLKDIPAHPFESYTPAE